LLLSAKILANSREEMESGRSVGATTPIFRVNTTAGIDVPHKRTIPTAVTKTNPLSLL
jgi:hypothetical protein